jgi:hypothetical protein
MPRNGEGRGVNKSENLSETPGGQGKGMGDLKLRGFLQVYVVNFIRELGGDGKG